MDFAAKRPNGTKCTLQLRSTGGGAGIKHWTKELDNVNNSRANNQSSRIVMQKPEKRARPRPEAAKNT